MIVGDQTEARASTVINYLTIIRRRRSEYWLIFPETKSRGIITNIHESEANNCFSINTQVIIKIPRRWDSFCCIAAILDNDRKPLARTTDYFSCNDSRLSP